MMKTYFYPIHIENLFVVFTTASLSPISLYQGERIRDVQTLNPGYILLADEPVTFGEEYCLLEVLLNAEEEVQLVETISGFHLYPSFLPVSRVCSIFSNQNKKFKRQIQLIEENTAFVPKHLLTKNMANGRVAEESTVEQIDQPNTQLSAIYAQHDLYNRLLGGVALGMIAGIEGKYISDKLVSILCNYCDLNDLGIANYLESSLFQNVKDILFSGSVVNEESIKNMARYEGLTIPETGNLIKKANYSSLKKASSSYILYVLYNYKTGDFDNDGLGTDTINAIISDRFKAVGVVTAFCYGVHRGYEVFNKQYMDIPVKFKLASSRDYLLIESIYHYALTQQKLDSYSHIDIITKHLEGGCATIVDDSQFDLFGEIYECNYQASAMQQCKDDNKLQQQLQALQIENERLRSQLNELKDEIARQNEWIKSLSLSHQYQPAVTSQMCVHEPILGFGELKADEDFLNTLQMVKKIRELDKKKEDILRACLEKRGVPCNGKKDELIARLYLAQSKE